MTFWWIAATFSLSHLALRIQIFQRGALAPGWGTLSKSKDGRFDCARSSLVHSEWVAQFRQMRGCWQLERHLLCREGITLVAKPTADRLAMLLSADWFAPYWRHFGIVLSEAECALVRQAAREVTRRLIGSVYLYWNIDFSEQRITDTKRSFADRVKAAGIAEAGREQILELLDDKTREQDEAATTLWLFGALLDQLSSGSPSANPPHIADDALRTIGSLWANRSSTMDVSDQLERAVLSASTEWDRYLRNLTPDLPTYLSDWASNRLRKPDDVRRFWAELFWVIPANDRLRLRRWLESESAKLADPGFVVISPGWMRSD